MSVKTVENHLTRLYRQLNVQSRLEAVNFSMRYPKILGTPGGEAAQTDDLGGLGLQKRVDILIVDDNTRYRKQLLRTIGKLCPRANIYEAEGIQDALHLAKRIELHLILIDVVLGDEDGISCARRIKNTSSQSRIILISAYPDREFHQQGLKSGAVAFLDKKDLDLSTLRHILEDIIP